MVTTIADDGTASMSPKASARRDLKPRISTKEMRMNESVEQSELERQIAELEKEVGFAIFPRSRSDYKDAESYYNFLRIVKGEKDRDSTVWQKMQNWD